MDSSMLEQEINVYSDKYDIKGVIKDYGMVIKLVFSYNGRRIVMGMSRPFPGSSYELLGRQIIDSYVDNLVNDNEKLMLHYWYVESFVSEGERYQMGHGVVTGHQRLTDGTWIHTSVVNDIHVDTEAEELVVTTMNSVYHCPLAYCDWEHQDEYSEVIPDYEVLSKKYKGMDTLLRPVIEPGKVLLVLANFCEYYFHSLYYVPEDSEDNTPCEYSAYPHVGTFQDSFLISAYNKGQECNELVDVRYFPHYQNIEFYSEYTDEKPLYVENIGYSVIYVQSSAGTIKLAPGERKEVTPENTEKEPPVLPDGDLYPAGVY